MSMPKLDPANILFPDWPAPARVNALVTTRQGGVSLAPWNSLNLAAHVGDKLEAVVENRRRLSAFVGANKDFQWLTQTHSTDVVRASRCGQVPEADASYTMENNLVCTVLTADCLPVFFCNRQGTQVAVAHAGWKGLGAGILEKTVASFSNEAGDILAWLGPAIGPTAFEVGEEVRGFFLARYPNLPASSCFVASGIDRWLMDMYATARYILLQQGLTAVYGGGLCSYSDPDRFFSYRRTAVCGRMASCIWLENPDSFE